MPSCTKLFLFFFFGKKNPGTSIWFLSRSITPVCVANIYQRTLLVSSFSREGWKRIRNSTLQTKSLPDASFLILDSSFVLKVHSKLKGKIMKIEYVSIVAVGAICLVPFSIEFFFWLSGSLVESNLPWNKRSRCIHLFACYV